MKTKYRHLTVSRIVSVTEGPNWVFPVRVRLHNDKELKPNPWDAGCSVLIEDGIRSVGLGEVLMLSQRWVLTADSSRTVEIVLSAEEIFMDTGPKCKLNMWCNG